MKLLKRSLLLAAHAVCQLHLSPFGIMCAETLNSSAACCIVMTRWGGVRCASARAHSRQHSCPQVAQKRDGGTRSYARELFHDRTLDDDQTFACRHVVAGFGEGCGGGAAGLAASGGFAIAGIV